MNDYNTEPPEKNWARIISPCVIGAVLGALIMIVGMVAGGYGIFGIILGAPFFAIMVIIDLLIKHFFKDGATKLWLIELALIVLTIIGFKLYFHWLF